MSYYILILVWLVVIAALSSMSFVYREELHGDKTELKTKVLFALIAMLPIVLMATYREMFGDTLSYRRAFLRMPDSFEEIPEYLEGIEKDRGFYLFSAIIKCIVTEDYRGYFFALAAFQGVTVAMLFRKYSPNFVVSLFLFVASCDYVSWMYNGVRQFTAVTIILLGTPLYLKRKIIPSILLILLASRFHQSSLLMIPFILIAPGKAWNWKTLLFVLGTITAVFFVDRFTNILDSMLVSTQYTNVVSDYTAFGDNGTNPIRVLVYSIPAIISFFFRKQIQEEDSPIINLCTNMSIFSMGLYIVSMFTSGIFLGRLPIYVSLYGYILLPWEIENLLDQKLRRIATILMILGFLGYYYYQMHYTWGLIVI